MKIIIIAYSILFSAVFVNAENMKYPINIILSNERNEVRDKIRIGVHENATNSLDTAFGEFELFQMFPPETLFGACEFYNEPRKENVWSYIDVRKLYKDSLVFTHTFRLVVSRGFGEKLKLSWSLLPEEVHSAWITDVVTKKILVINMKDSLSADIQNEFINDFFVNITYNPGGLSVESISEYSVSELFPNPTENKLFIRNQNKEIAEIHIYDVLGKIRYNSSCHDFEHTIDTSFLNEGSYFCCIIYFDGSSESKVFFKK